MHREKRVDHTRIQVASGYAPDLGDRFLHGPRGLVGPNMGEGVKYVGYRDDPADERYRLARETIRISRAVPPLVVVFSDHRRHLEDG